MMETKKIKRRGEQFVEMNPNKNKNDGNKRHKISNLT